MELSDETRAWMAQTMRKLARAYCQKHGVNCGHAYTIIGEAQFDGVITLEEAQTLLTGNDVMIYSHPEPQNPGLVVNIAPYFKAFGAF